MVEHRQNVQRLRNGGIEIYVRADVQKPIWQARMRHPGGKRYLIRSLKTLDQQDAVQFAEEWFDEVRFKHRHGLIVQPRTVSEICDLYLKQLKEEVAAEITNPRHLQDYAPLVDRYVKGYFGRRHIDQLKLKDIEAFWAWCRDYWTSGPGASEKNKVYHRGATRIVAPTRKPKPLSASALAKIFVVLRDVFRTAVKHEALREANVPAIKEGIRKPNGRGIQNRSAFSIDEYRTLYRFLRYWPKSAATEDARQQRLLLWDYVIVLMNSGVRPGTETDGLRWKHVERFVDPHDGKDYVRLWVNGKTGERQLIAMPRAGVALNRIKQRRTEHLGHEPAPEEHVFCLADGTAVKEDYLRALFRRALTEADLLYDAMGRRRSLYSCRHIYATFRLIYGRVNVFTLADNMGTSVAMIKEHYSKLTPTLARVELTQVVKRAAIGGR